MKIRSSRNFFTFFATLFLRMCGFLRFCKFKDLIEEKTQALQLAFKVKIAENAFKCCGCVVIRNA